VNCAHCSQPIHPVFEQASVRGHHWYHLLCSPDYAISATDYWAARPDQIPIHAHLVDNWSGGGVHDFRVYYFFSNLVDPSESDQYQESTLAVVPLRVPKELLENKRYHEALEVLRTQLEARGFTVYRNLHRNLPWDNWRYDDLEGRENRYPPVYVETDSGESPVLVEQDGKLRCGQCGAALGRLSVSR
jgi:hypothetical protein